MENKKKLNNPFVGRNDGFVSTGNDYSCPELSEVIEVQKVKKTGDGDEDFVVFKELKINKVLNRQEFVNQFKDDVGVLNVLKRVGVSGDQSLLNERPVASGHMDLTNMPDNIIDAGNMIDRANDLYNKLPDDIKNKLSKEDLLKINNLELANAIQDYVITQEKLKNVKDGDINE